MDSTDKTNASRRRRTEAGALIDRTVSSLSKRAADLSERLEKLEPGTPAGPLADDLANTLSMLDKAQGVALCREWSRKLALSILRNASILASAPGATPAMRKLAGYAVRAQKEMSADNRTRAARLKKELGLSDVVEG